jgi:Holliday junction resolvase-like predicted endonuclease
MNQPEPSARTTEADGCKPTVPGASHDPARGRDARDDRVFPADSGTRPTVNRALTPRRRRQVTENDEYAAFARRVLRAWARRVAAGDIDAITDIAAAAGELEGALRQAVAGLRRKGYSWAEIAARLGVTRQAAQQRWGASGRDLVVGTERHGRMPPRRRSSYATAACTQPGGSPGRPCWSRPPGVRSLPSAASTGDRREALPPSAQTGRSNAMRVKEALAEAAGHAAASYLEGRGFSVLDRNWQSGTEIIPIMAADRRVLVVIDLRIRAGTRHATPLEAIGADRQRTMRQLAARWLAEHGKRYDQIRIDVVGLLQEGTGGFTIEHIRAVG